MQSSFLKYGGNRNFYKRQLAITTLGRYTTGGEKKIWDKRCRKHSKLYKLIIGKPAHIHSTSLTSNNLSNSRNQTRLDAFDSCLGVLQLLLPQCCVSLKPDVVDWGYYCCIFHTSSECTIFSYVQPSETLMYIGFSSTNAQPFLDFSPKIGTKLTEKEQVLMAFRVLFTQGTNIAITHIDFGESVPCSFQPLPTICYDVTP